VLGGWARQEGGTEEREYAYLVLGARRPRRPGDGPETWRMAAAGAQTSSGERESAHARVVSRERRREGRWDWKFQICLLPRRWSGGKSVSLLKAGPTATWFISAATR